MCVAIPGKIVSIDGENAIVDIRGNTANIDIRMIDANVGDYILIHAGCALEVMQEDSYNDLVELHDLLEGTLDEN